jgi:hypothetical protein
MWKGSETTYETNSETGEKVMYMKQLSERNESGLLLGVSAGES